jgi:hypothetical protein
MLFRILGALIGACLSVASSFASPQQNELLIELASRELTRCQDELAQLRRYVQITDQSDPMKAAAANAVPVAEAQCEKLKHAIEQATQTNADLPRNPPAPRQDASTSPAAHAPTPVQLPAGARDSPNPTGDKAIAGGKSRASLAERHIHHHLDVPMKPKPMAQARRDRVPSDVAREAPTSPEHRSTAVANPRSARDYLLVAKRNLQAGTIREANDALETAETYALNNNAAYKPGQDPTQSRLIRRIEGAREALRVNDRSGALFLTTMAIPSPDQKRR